VAVRALTRNFGMSAKKVRRVLWLIRGKRADDALGVLRLMPSPAAEAVAKTLRSAVANAETNNFMAADDLKVVAAFANDAPMLKRFRPKARGRISPIKRRSCHITVEVEEEASEGGA
jgi:large subunit ribosomal protein L22